MVLSLFTESAETLMLGLLSSFLAARGATPWLVGVSDWTVAVLSLSIFALMLLSFCLGNKVASTFALSLLPTLLGFCSFFSDK